MRRLKILSFLAVLAVFIFAFFKNNRYPAAAIDRLSGAGDHTVTRMRNEATARLERYAGDAKAYVLKHAFNNRYCFLIDMKMSSGSRRFFVYDLKNDSVVKSGLVTHGSGINNLSDTMIFSNELGGNCSSPGKYKIGKPYHGKFGLAYKLYGLDKTNSNAFNRFVVLHSHSCVPDNEVAPQQICTSWGCPTVSPEFLNQLKTYIDRSDKPVLLWIFK
ncbi:MAG: murein L,D-transpeptidase catalytic domain-containing protein [Ferruginibacter sp.]